MKSQFHGSVPSASILPLTLKLGTSVPSLVCGSWGSEHGVRPCSLYSRATTVLGGVPSALPRLGKHLTLVPFIQNESTTRGTLLLYYGLLGEITREG